MKRVSNDGNNKSFFSSRNVPRHQRNVIANQTKYSMAVENSAGVSKNIYFIVYFRHCQIISNSYHFSSEKMHEIVTPSSHTQFHTCRQLKQS